MFLSIELFGKGINVMNTKIIKFANPNEGFSAAQLLQSWRSFIVREIQAPYSVDKDISKLLKQNYPDEYVKQVKLGNIPAIKTKKQ